MASINDIKIHLDKKILEALKRRTALLERALESLKSVEWEINIEIIADIEEELNRGLDGRMDKKTRR